MRTSLQEYTTADIERALREVAECRGNAAMAARRLEQRGLSIPERTLQDWRTRHGDRYAHVLAEVEDQVHRTIADEYESLALEGIQAQRTFLGDLIEKKGELTGKELATALNSTAMAAGIATDKSSALRGRPTAIIENRNPYELLEKWAPVFQQYIEGSAEEIPAGELEQAAPPKGGSGPAIRGDSQTQRAQD